MIFKSYLLFASHIGLSHFHHYSNFHSHGGSGIIGHLFQWFLNGILFRAGEHVADALGPWLILIVIIGLILYFIWRKRN